MRSRLITLVLAAGIANVCPLLALAQTGTAEQPTPVIGEVHRQLGAHAYGQGKLSVAFERRMLELELEAPASDIVGFEYAAKTPEQKAAVAAARTTLAKPLALFRFPDAAGCKVASVKVELVSGDAHDHDHDHGPAKPDAASKGDAAAAHSEFHAEYAFTCAKPELLRAFDTDYFKTFPNAQSLDVSLIGPKGQSKQLVTREKPRIDLSGAN